MRTTNHTNPTVRAILLTLLIVGWLIAVPLYGEALHLPLAALLLIAVPLWAIFRD